MAVCEPGRILTRNRTLILGLLPPELKKKILLFKGTPNPTCGILLRRTARSNNVSLSFCKNVPLGPFSLDVTAVGET